MDLIVKAVELATAVVCLVVAVVKAVPVAREKRLRKKNRHR